MSNIDKTEKFRYLYTGLIIGALLTIGVIIASRTFEAPPPVTMPYPMYEPNGKITLNKDLREISGLSYLGEQRILAVQDEEGIIFQINMASGEIEKEYEFHKDGDYEGIAHHEDTAWIVRSDGNIYEVVGYDSENRQREKYDTPLSGKNNIEGLCFVPDRNALWLACKNDAKIDDTWDDKRTIYEFNLSTKELNINPVLVIDEVAISTFVNDKYGSSLEYTFKPSGIEIHPITKDIYIVASSGKMLAVFRQDGSLKDVERLSTMIFKQPEGITFDEAGNLIVSNEGKKGKANILMFQYKGE